MKLKKSFDRMHAVVFVLVLIIGWPPVSLANRAPGWAESFQAQRAARLLPPARYIPNHNFDTKHIALNLRFDWEREWVIGNETIVFAPLVANLKNVELDAGNMTFSSVRMSSGAQLKHDVDTVNEKIRIFLDRVYQPNETLTVSIEYHTNGPQLRKLGLVGTGVRFIKPNPEDPSRPKQIWSQGESEYNHFWFPCYDHPNDFFTSELTATVEKPLSVISNGKLLETKENNDGTRTFHWKIDQPHASYLSSIIVGEYTPIQSEYAGVPITTNVYPREVEEGKVTSARLTEMVKFFSEKTGVKYPYAKYAQTMVRDFGGGMENISATTQTDNMIHDARTELDQTSDGLQSHELAHQWFGDYLTCRNWADIWLNESFATYFQAMWDEHKLGRDDFLYSDVKGNQDSYLTTWKQGNRRPIVTKNYLNPDAVFDTYAYPRGGAVLHMLRKNLGEENWWRAINHYLRKHAHQPVQTEEFRIAIEESTGQSMEWFFDEWLYKMGHPVFRVSQNYDATAKTLKLTVEQIQKLDPEYPFPQVELFQTPLEIEIGTVGTTTIESIQIEPKREQTFTFKVDSKPLLVNFDYNQTVIKELEFNKSLEDLTYQLSRDQDVLGRVWALSQLTGRLNTATVSDNEKQQIASRIADAVRGDKSWAVRLEATTALAGVTGETARSALLAATKDPNAGVRARALTSLAQSKDASLANLFQQFLNDPSYGVIRAAAFALGQTKSPGAYEVLVNLLSEPSWRDTIKASALSGLSVLGDKRSLELGLRHAASGNQPQVRVAAVRLLCNIGKDDSRIFPLIAKIATDAIDRMDYNLMAASLEAIASLGDVRGLALLEEFAKKAADIPQVLGLIVRFQESLKKNTGTAVKPATQP